MFDPGQPRLGGSCLHRAVVLSLVAIAAGLAPAAAQVRAGLHGSYQTQILEGSYGFGGRAEFDLSFLPGSLALAGTYDHFFPDCASCSASDIGVQVIIDAQPMYLGLGTSYRRFEAGESSDSDDLAVNLVAGIRIAVLPVLWPYLEYRQEIGSGTINEQTFSLGVVFSPARARTAPGRRPPR